MFVTHDSVPPVNAETGLAEGLFPAGLGLPAGAVGQQPLARKLRDFHPSALLRRRVSDGHPD